MCFRTGTIWVILTVNESCSMSSRQECVDAVLRLSGSMMHCWHVIDCPLIIGALGRKNVWLQLSWRCWGSLEGKLPHSICVILLRTSLVCFECTTFLSSKTSLFAINTMIWGKVRCLMSHISCLRWGLTKVERSTILFSSHVCALPHPGVKNAWWDIQVDQDGLFCVHHKDWTLVTDVNKKQLDILLNHLNGFRSRQNGNQS